MELVRCPNCLAVYGDVQENCPTCHADHSGQGAEIEFDAEVRSALNSLGGIYGGILEGPPGPWVLWCERGICLVEAAGFLLWKTRIQNKVENVVLEHDRVRITTPLGEVHLDLAEGYELDD
jgi:hypothetical protein